MGLMPFLSYSHRQPQGVLVILYLTPGYLYLTCSFPLCLAPAKTDLYGMGLPWAPLLSDFCLGLANSRHCQEKVKKTKKQGIPSLSAGSPSPFSSSATAPVRSLFPQLHSSNCTPILPL